MEVVPVRRSALLILSLRQSYLHQNLHRDVLQLSKISKRATGWVDQTPSHAARFGRNLRPAI